MIILIIYYCSFLLRYWDIFTIKLKKLRIKRSKSIQLQMKTLWINIAYGNDSTIRYYQIQQINDSYDSKIVFKPNGRLNQMTLQRKNEIKDIASECNF